MSSIKHAVIAAAGLGSRLGRGHPKCLLEIEGQTILERQLNLLKDVADVRVVVGFEEQAVVSAANAIRSDIVFVRNAAFRSTTTLHSYALGAQGLAENCLFMDADIIFEPASFADFLKSCDGAGPVIAVTSAKTTDAVFTHIENERVIRFSRSEPAEFEWANLCWLPPQYCETGEGSVYERLNSDLPLNFKVIKALEIDTPYDYQNAIENLHKF